MQQYYAPPPAWQRAIKRSLREGLKATRMPNGNYRVASVSVPNTQHIVRLADGKIVECTECKGWDNGGRARPCKHAGSVALARAFEQGITLIEAKTH